MKSLCKCAKCDAMACGASPEEAERKIREWQQKCLADHGFFIHIVGSDPDILTGFNFHTHGLQELNNHLDFQLVIPLQPEVANSIVVELVKRVQAGEKFTAGQKVEGIIKNGPIKLFETTEQDRKVLRIILPDVNGHLDEEDIDDVYVGQYNIIRKNPKPKKWKPRRI